MPPLLSVVVVTRNDRPGLEETLLSLQDLLEAAGDKIEVIVADGDTHPPVVDLVTRLVPNAKLDPTPDTGIYDGMNKGLGASSGRFVWFLNGGDSCATRDWSMLKASLEDNLGKIVFHDYDLAYPDGTVKRRKSRPTPYIRHALPTSHQAIFFPGEAARARGYDTTYDISGDYALTAAMIADGALAVRGGLVVAAFRPGGSSSVRILEVSKQAARVQREILGVPWWQRRVSKAIFFVSRARARHALTRRDQTIPPASTHQPENPWKDFKQDKSRYGPKPWLLQPALYAVATYRFGRSVFYAPAPVRPVVHAIYFIAYSIVRLVTGIDIPRTVRIGPGLMIHHFGGVIVNPQVRIGADFTMRHGLTVGTANDDELGVPTIGDRVTVGANATILGDICIGNDVTIGASAVVLQSCDNGVTLVGIPARPIRPVS